MLRLCLCLSCLVVFNLVTFSSYGQSSRSAVQDNRELFKPLDLPPPGTTRSAEGAPGPAYWQQQVNYDIDVRLDPSRRLVSGAETITYFNNSPDPLNELWLQLDQNLFSSRSRGASVQPRGSRFTGSFEQGGFDIKRLVVRQDGLAYDGSYEIDDTRMRLALQRPLAPAGDSLQIDIEYSFVIPEYGADRMGMLRVNDGTIFEIAQWYPRMFVYDDVTGWDTLPYLGQGEFYLEYGNFDVRITLPRDYMVVATGELLNPEEVYTTDQQRRLATARNSAETVLIVRPDEVDRAGKRPPGKTPLTWKYRAENVRDFAWAASDAFIIDAASWENVLIMSAYPREGIGSEDTGEVGWEESTQMGRHTISYYSQQWFRYPYPVAINVAGIVGGMEYPMIVFCSVHARDEGLFFVTDHEFGHSWFPMIVGSNERRYAWMDEGFNSFINDYSGSVYHGQQGFRTGPFRTDLIGEQMKALVKAEPVDTPPDSIGRGRLSFLAYRKPATALVLLRENVLGPERFDQAMKTYIERWAYKHPQPADFYRTFASETGEDLSWFWRGWFMTSDVLDQALLNVSESDGRTIVEVGNREGLVMPVDLKVTYSDGHVESRRIPATDWATSSTIKTEFSAGSVVSVTIDPQNLMPDVNRSNNTWKKR